MAVRTSCRQPADALPGTGDVCAERIAMATFAVMQGASLVRVHDVRATAHAVRLLVGTVAA